MNRPFASLCVLISASLPACADPPAADVRTIDNGAMKIGIDLKKGAAITWLSWKDYPQNMVNIADPGRLIQQSYYAGRRLDRTKEGQWKSWSPWSWNPIQGGGVESWARIGKFELKNQTLYSETIPKLWDMPNEEAAAVMKQWTNFEPDMPDVVVIKCEFTSHRSPRDRWGPTTNSPQEVPACYFTRNFDSFKSYLGKGKWREETQPPGPPWGHADPPLRAMACFNDDGQGVAVFSPTSDHHWNFGPHARGKTTKPTAGPCVHVAPISRVRLAPNSTYTYRYWLAVGTEKKLTAHLDALRKKYADERATLTVPPAKP